MRALIVGCGYIGLPVGAELARQGHEVFGIRRSVDSASVMQAAGIEPLIADITKCEELARIPLPFDWVVNTTSSSRGDAEDYREVYFKGTQNLLDWLAASPPKKFVYTSSTSVYEQTDGAQVSETSPTEPTAPTARVLLETEKLLLSAAQSNKFPAVILRVAGIYGPDRGYYISQFIKGEAKMTGHGERLINMIHRDDLVGVILTALKSGHAGQTYNAVDEEPVPQIRLFRWLSEALAMKMPPFVAESEESRKRAMTNKKVSNRKLKMELGYVFKYPTFREGCTAEIQRLEDAGVL